MIKGHLSPLLPAPLGPDFQLSSEWFRVPRTCEYMQLPQSTIYELLDDPKSGIISFQLKLRKGQKRGIRYIWRPSLDAYLNRRAIEDGVNPQAIMEPASAK
jgi:hypothetical protein